MLTIQAILDINAYEVRMPHTNIQASYALASLAEHNCTPNTHKTISSKSIVSMPYTFIIIILLQKMAYINQSNYNLQNAHTMISLYF